MRPKVITILSLLALLVAACGSGNESTETEADPDTQTTAEAPSAADENDSADQDETDESDSESEDDSGASQGLQPGGSGTVIINGETIEPEWVANCEIDEQFDPQPGDLDVVVSLDGGLEALFMRVSTREPQGVPSEDSYTYMTFSPELQLRSESGDFVSYETAGSFVTGPDGTWYVDEVGNLPMRLAVDIEHEGVALDEPPVVIDGDDIRGAATLESGDGSIEVEFDLTLADPVDCSL